MCFEYETDTQHSAGKNEHRTTALDSGGTIITTGNLLGKTYPVGAIYISTSSTSPASLFGGTWEQLKDRFLIGAGNSYAVNATGGATTVALSEANMPSHNHTLTGLSIETNTKTSNHLTMQGDGNFVMYSNNGALWDSGTGNSGSTNKWGWTIGRTTDGTNTNSKGSGTAHNNMPPYLAVYMWKRTA